MYWIDLSLFLVQRALYRSNPTPSFFIIFISLFWVSGYVFHLLYMLLYAYHALFDDQMYRLLLGNSGFVYKTIYVLLALYQVPTKNRQRVSDLALVIDEKRQKVYFMVFIISLVVMVWIGLSLNTYL